MVGQKKRGEMVTPKIWTWRASCIWKTGDSGAPGSTPSLWGRAPIILCSPTLLKHSKANPLRKSCHRAMFLCWVLFFPLFFLSSLIWNVSYTTIYLSRTHALLELAGFTGIPSRRAPCKTGLGCACAHPLLSEVMDPGLTFWVRYNSGITTDRQKDKVQGDKKKKGWGKCQEERGWHFTLAFEVAANLPDKFWKEEL